MSPPLSPAKGNQADIWEDALSLLSENDQQRFEFVFTKDQERQNLLYDVLSAATLKKEECLRKRWKINLTNKTIILRDVLEKVSVWVRKFIAVGDTIMQYDPGHAALPWAAIRFCLQVTVNDVQIYGTFLQSVEQNANLLARCSIMERLYLYRESEVTERFRQALVTLYAAILTNLAKGLRYFGQNTAKRIVKSIGTNIKDVESWSSNISEKEAEVERLAALADAEKTDNAADNLDELRVENQHLAEMSEERHEELLQLLKDLKQPIARIDSQLSALNDNLQMETRIKILNAISKIVYPIHHRNASRDRLEGSGKWLLEKAAYRDWRADSSSSVLWVHGIPGSGKTKLASLVIDDIKSSAHVAYFYCMRNSAEPERAECDKILNCMVRQLASTSTKSPILEPVRLKYELAIDGFEGFEDQAWTTEDSTEVLIELTNVYPSITIVVDALDEVNPMDRLELLDALNKIVRNSSNLVKLFISSRDSIDIVMHLSDSPNLYISATDNWKDIDAFVNQRLDAVKLLHGKLPDTLRNKIAKTLIDGAHGMFRWVDLQIQSLRTLKVAADIEARLGCLPETLEGSYWDIFEQIQASGEHAANLAKLTFQWLLSAQSSINIEDFAVLASVSSGNSETTYTASEILDVCANLIVDDGADSFRFAHLSVREFLEGLSKKRQIDYFQPEQTNAALASACLSYLSSLISDLEKDPRGGNLETPLVKEDSDNRRLRKYTAIYWPSHVSKCGSFKNKPPLESQIRSFLVNDKGVAPGFERWCEEINDIEMIRDISPSEDIKEAAKWNPVDPIWLAITHDLLDLDSIDLADTEMAGEAFVHGAEMGNFKVLLSLLEHGISVQKYGHDAISAACKTGRVDVVTMLLEKGAPTGPKNLYWAILCQHMAVADVLLERGPYKFTDVELSKALTTAASDGNVDLVTMLVKHGARKEGVAVLRAIKNGTLRAAHNLIDNGFNLTGQYLMEKRTALHWAAEKGFIETTSKLLAKGVPANTKDRHENTPLHLAARKGHFAVVSVLLNERADIEAKNVIGRTPLHLASMMNHPATVSVLLAHGAEFEVKDLEGWTPLQLAQIYQHEGVIRLLQRSNSPVQQPTPQGSPRYPQERSDTVPDQPQSPEYTQITIPFNTIALEKEEGSSPTSHPTASIPALVLTPPD